MANKTNAELSLVISASAYQFNKTTSEVAAKTEKTAKSVKGSTGKMKGSVSNMTKGAGSQLQGMAGSLSSLGPAGAIAGQGLQAMSGGARALNLALGPIGIIIGIIAIAIKALMSYFKGTTDGAAALTRIMGTLRGIMAVVTDIFIKVGEVIFNAFKNPKETLDKLVEGLKNLGGKILDNIKSRFEGFVNLFKAGWSAIANGAKAVGLAIAGIFNKKKKDEAGEYFDAMKEDMLDVGRAAVQMNTGFTPEEIGEGFKKAGGKIANVFTRAQDLAKKFNTTVENSQKIADKENLVWEKKNKFILEGAKLEREIAELRVEAGDRSKSAEERAIILNKLEGVTNDFYEKRVAIEKLDYEIKRDINALGKSIRDDLDEENTLLAQIQLSRAEQAKQQRFIVNTGATIADEAEREAKAYEKALATKNASDQEESKMAINAFLDAEIEESMAAIQTQLDAEPPLELVTPISDNEAWANGWVSTIDTVKNSWHEAISTMGEDFAQIGSIINDVLINSVLMFGEELGKLATGAKTNFKDIITGALQAGQAILQIFLAEAVAGVIKTATAGGAIGGPLGVVAGLVAASAGVAAIMSLWKSKVPAFGDGGYVDKPTLALIGEKGPEYIVPAGKTVGFGKQQQVYVTGRLVGLGSDLIGVIDNYETLQTIG